MSRIETEPFPSQDDLPPEIQRRLQVEELWARRHVLADLMNEERLELFARRCAVLAVDTAYVGSRAKLTKLAATIVPMRKFLMPAKSA